MPLSKKTNKRRLKSPKRKTNKRRLKISRKKRKIMKGGTLKPEQENILIKRLKYNREYTIIDCCIETDHVIGETHAEEIITGQHAESDIDQTNIEFKLKINDIISGKNNITLYDQTHYNAESYDRDINQEKIKKNYVYKKLIYTPFISFNESYKDKYIRHYYPGTTPEFKMQLKDALEKLSKESDKERISKRADYLQKKIEEIEEIEEKNIGSKQEKVIKLLEIFEPFEKIFKYSKDDKKTNMFLLQTKNEEFYGTFTKFIQSNSETKTDIQSNFYKTVLKDEDLTNEYFNNIFGFKHDDLIKKINTIFNSGDSEV
tara:strand:- start:554 stop:1501 length:948 start_codon:yes stop_codon:yes gene_type:complete